MSTLSDLSTCTLFSDEVFCGALAETKIGHYY